MAFDPNAPFRLVCFKNPVPNAMRPWILVLVVILLQTSNVVYLSSMAQMYGGLSLMREDITYCLYAAFAGMNTAFPALWRFKTTFTTRTTLTICSVGMIVCNIASAYTGSMPLLIFICFVGGFLKMWATFECISTINPWLAPGFDFARFFPILYMLILGPIQLTTAIDTYLTYYTNWEMMHWLVVGFYLLILLVARGAMTDFYPMGKLPFLSFDFAGLVLWGLLMLQMSFIAIYGEHYDWLKSGEIRLAIGTTLITLALCLRRMAFIRHPYIKYDAFCYLRVPVALLLFFLMDVMMETPNSLQNILTGSLLGYDSVNTVNFCWYALAGTLAGCILSLYWMRIWRLPIIRLAFVGFACAILYQVCMYFVSGERASIYHFYLPTFLRNFGYACVYSSLTYYLKEQIPFNHFLQVLSLVGVIRSGIGGTVGEAIYGHALRWSMAKNSQQLGRIFDGLGAPGEAFERYGTAMREVMAVSIKELWGWTIVGAILLFLMILLFDTPVPAMVRRLPSRLRHRRTAR